MIIVQLQNVVKEYNGEPLFKPITFEVNEKEKIAIIGPNGTGKSTIIKLITGELETDGGNVVIGKGFSIGYLSQSVISDLNNTLYEEAFNVFNELYDMEINLQKLCQKLEEEPDNKELLDSYSRFETRFSELGGYDYRYKIEMMLSKFGFTKDDYGRQMSTFSGGERMKMAFAKLLLQKPDLLLLDEPTNHLDIDTIEWLETYLKSYQGAILFVSHDRYFINSLANKIIELDQHHIEIYVGDYDRYSVLKKERYEQQLKAFKLQQAEIKKLEWFITYYMPKPRFVSRAHDREKKLGRIKANLIEAPKETKNRMNIDIKGQVRTGKRLISIENLEIGYDKPLVKDINLLIFGGDKIAVLGPNGAGKTTFIKTIRDEIKPLDGSCNFLTDLKIGYLRQDGINLKSPSTLFEYFRNTFPNMSNQDIYNHMGQYNFSYEDTNEKIIDNLSGGERMRVVIAELVLKNFDMIILDEPTNHLDMMTKDELISALNAYKGTLLIVSHDRYFVDRTADKIIYFYDGHAYVYEGSYSEFKMEKLDPMIESISNEAKPIKNETKVVKPQVKKDKKERPKLAKNKIEEKMERIERILESEHSKLDMPEYFNDYSKMKEVEDSIKSLESEYESLLTDLEYYENNN